ncbi:MAG: hypothetical protein JRI68_14925 [Deltaproteobacteria bacterium]|nr:hypothetical protein [Deltaproteobacteria bacterium]
MLRFFVLSALALTATGCTDIWNSAATGPHTIAVGARATYGFSGSQAVECSLRPDVPCAPPISLGTGDVESASAADSSILEVLAVGQNDPIQPDMVLTYPVPVAFVRGRAPGKTELSLSDGVQSRWLTVRALEPDRIEWDPRCLRNLGEPMQETIWLPVGIEWFFVFHMWQGSTELAGYGLEGATDAGSLELVQEYGTNSGHSALYQVPDQPGPTALTTTTPTASVTLPIEVFEVSQLDELDLITRDPGPYPANGDEVYIFRRLFVGENLVCEDPYFPFVTIRWAVETPGFCAFRGQEGLSYDSEGTATSVRTYGDGGTCTVSAEALGTGLTASIDLEFVAEQ